MKREYIKTGNCSRIMQIMAEGSEEAAGILQECSALFKETWYFVQWMLMLDDMNIRGDQISLLYGNYVEDAPCLIQCIMAKDPGVVEFLNNAYYGESRACVGGAERPGKPKYPNHDRQIWLVDTDGKVLYQLGLVAYIMVTDEDHNERISVLEYLSDDFFLIDHSVVMHFMEFADIVDKHHYQIRPVPARPHSKFNILYRPPRSATAMRQHKKMVAQINNV